MKKIVCVLVALCAMLLMCSMAGAACDHEWTYVSLGRFYHVKMCESCGLSNDESHSSTSSWEWIDLGNMHSAVCKYCDEDMYQTSNHSYSCTSDDPSRCDTCGISGISSENIVVEHRFEATNFGSYHDYVCADCGEKDPYSE